MAGTITTTSSSLDVEIPEVAGTFHELWTDILEDWIADPAAANSKINALLELRELSRV